MQDLDDVSALLEALNPAQREAVCAPQGNILVLAGAGSGKTRVLIHRIAWLIRVERVSPFRILAVTFTNKAAGEMRARLQNMLELPAAGMWVGTFHGLAHRFLRIHWEEAKLPQAFQILDSDDQYRTVRRVLKALQLDEKRWPPKQAQWYINNRKDEGLRPRDIDPENDRFEIQRVAIYRAYQEHCERGGMVDFAELLLRVYELFRDNPEVLRHYQDRFQHLLADEFQDTNTIQYRWLHLLCGQEGKVFAVGDDDQSIYGWRGAQAENLQRFRQDFAGANLARLEQNYRSTATILKAANVLISNNQGRLGKNLWTEGEKGEPVALYSAFNEIDEARFVAERIQDWTGHPRPYKECAVLYRSNAQSRVMEETLIQAGIPYRIHGGLRFFERAEIKDAMAYLRLTANRDDDAAFERAINTPPRGIGGRTVEIIRAGARANGASLWQSARNLVISASLSTRARNAVAGFLELIGKNARDNAKLPLDKLFECLINASRLKEHYKKEKGEKGQMRIENLDELVNAARQYMNEGYSVMQEEDSSFVVEHSALTDFLSRAALEAGEAQGDPNQDCVQLMTLHSAKGLEFPLVFLCGMEEGLFPHSLALQDSRGLEEERRLCYVGMTRAMRQLYFTHAEVRRLHGKDDYKCISRFVGEVPAELLQEVRFGEAASHPVYTPPAPAHSALRTGMQVRHPKSGKKGIVLAVEGEGNSERVQVDFGWNEKKWFIVALTNLEIL
ncbi:MAG: DNA helicase II [Gammaproteobacteria bacterium]|nr:DNA helicase II [Gammaproteobacteria bacterium]